MESYDNSGQDTSNFDNTNDSYNAYDSSHRDNYESQHQHGSSHNEHQANYEPPQHHHGSTNNEHYSYTKEHDSPKTPETKSVEFNLPPSSDETSDLIDIDIKKDDDDDDVPSQESTPQLGNYENSIIDHFDSAFVNVQKDIGANESQKARNENGNMNNQNDNSDKDDYGCCSCKGGPLVCLAFFCDCFGGL